MLSASGPHDVSEYSNKIASAAQQAKPRGQYRTLPDRGVSFVFDTKCSRMSVMSCGLR